MTTNRKWTEQEDKIIQDMIAAKLGIDALVKVLLSRTKIAIKQRVNDLGLSLYGSGPEIDMDEFKRLMKGVK